MKNRAGEFKPNLSGESKYMSFLPTKLPPDPLIEYDSELIQLLIKAHRSIGTLEGISKQIPNKEWFISMYVRKEALLSSQLEGTQATLDDILDPSIDENKNRNIAEVIRYIIAFQFAQNRLKELPLCNRLLRETHETLMTDLRGGEKYPGEFRSTQNWIGPSGSTLKTARFIPPNPEDMIEAMSELEKFINQEDDIDPLIKIALIHYQFETIHPFLDGNGRIGRLLILLFLIEKKVLSHETLYISYFLKRNRIEYYDRLMEVRLKGNFEQWIKFFIRAVCESADDSISTIEQLVILNDKNTELIRNTGRGSATLSKLLKHLESTPIIDIRMTSETLGLSFPTISKAVNKMIELGILRQMHNTQRRRVFVYEEYMAILRKDTEI